MKRSTTPAIKQKNNPNVKSTAHLKVISQLKINNQNAASNTNNIKQQKRSQQLSKPLTNVDNNLAQQQYHNCLPIYNQKPKQMSSKTSKQNSFKKNNLNSYDKYYVNNNFNQTNNYSNSSTISNKNNQNPEIKEWQSPVNSKTQEYGNLTSYLISKSWQNSSYILSSQVNLSMKKLVIEWIIELSHYMKLKRETLYHSMWIFERCIQKITDLNAKNLQLLAITCLFISTKYEQIYPPHVIALIQKTMNIYNKKQVIQLQQKILIALNFQLTAPNRYTFLSMLINNDLKYLEEYDTDNTNFEHLRSKNINRNTKNALLSFNNSANNLNQSSSNSNQNKRYIDFVHYILQLTLIKSFPQTYSQKQIADAVIYLADKVIKKSPCSTNQQQQQSSDWLYVIKIQQIAYEIINIWKENKNSIISYLYDCDKWSFVGGLTILF